MALILEESLYSPVTNPLPDSLVHSYNKHCFKDFNEAEYNLTNKTLLPGEVAFAYYYDYLSPYGQNAIAAVGPLTHGTGNIIFKNSIEIESITDKLNETIADVNASINYLRDDLLDSVDNALTHLDSSLNYVMDKFVSADNNYKLQIENIFNNISDNNTSIMKAVNSSYNKLSTQVNSNNTNINKLITNVSNGLYNRIDTVNSSIVKFIDDLFTTGFNTVLNNANENLESTASDLSKRLSNFNSSLIKSVNDLEQKLMAQINNLRIDVSKLLTEIDTNRTLYYNLEHKYDKKIGNITSDIYNITVKLNTIEHVVIK